MRSRRPSSRQQGPRASRSRSPPARRRSARPSAWRPSPASGIGGENKGRLHMPRPQVVLRSAPHASPRGGTSPVPGSTNPCRRRCWPRHPRRRGARGSPARRSPSRRCPGTGVRTCPPRTRHHTSRVRIQGGTGFWGRESSSCVRLRLSTGGLRGGWSTRTQRTEVLRPGNNMGKGGTSHNSEKSNLRP